jgi:UrcA family protein
MRFHSVISCLALAGLLSPLTAASAAPVTLDGYEVASRVVNFSDLNLNSGTDVATLYSRIKSAADEVCEPVNHQPVDFPKRMRLCKQHAIDQAVADAKSSQLQTFHLSTIGESGVALSR